jgi:hypothetical protein
VPGARANATTFTHVFARSNFAILAPTPWRAGRAHLSRQLKPQCMRVGTLWLSWLPAELLALSSSPMGRALIGDDGRAEASISLCPEASAQRPRSPPRRSSSMKKLLALCPAKQDCAARAAEAPRSFGPVAFWRRRHGERGARARPGLVTRAAACPVGSTAAQVERPLMGRGPAALRAGRF